MIPRRSGRHFTAKDGASATDEDALAKAMRRKAESFSTPVGTSRHKQSFLSFSTSAVSSKLSAVGVSMGRSEKEVVLSANVLKHVEYDRLRVSPSVSKRQVLSPIVDDEANDTIDGQLLSHLVGEVTEVGLDESRLGSFDDLYASGRRSKSAKNNKKQASRKNAKKTTSPTVSR